MEKMYEVLRFQEYKDQCRQSADCLEGCLLIYYLQEHECIGKGQLFSWFRQLWKSLYDYQRSNGMNYGCLTPYSVLVVGEAGLFLLDPVGEENAAACSEKSLYKKRRQTAGQGTKECGSVWIREIDAVSSCLSKDRTGTDKKRGGQMSESNRRMHRRTSASL